MHADREEQEVREQAIWRMLVGQRRRDLVTPAHSHKALGRDSSTTETYSSLLFRLFGGRKWIRLVKAKSSDPFNILSVLYIVIFESTDSPFGDWRRETRGSV